MHHKHFPLHTWLDNLFNYSIMRFSNNWIFDFTSQTILLILDAMTELGYRNNSLISFICVYTIFQLYFLTHMVQERLRHHTGGSGKKWDRCCPMKASVWITVHAPGVGAWNETFGWSQRSHLSLSCPPSVFASLFSLLC